MSEFVLDKVGYQSEAAFSRAFKSEFKQSAGEVWRGAVGIINSILKNNSIGSGLC